MEDGEWDFHSYYDKDSEQGDISYEANSEHTTSYIIVYILTIVISLPGNLCIVLSVWRKKALNDAVWYMLAAISLSLAIHNITTTFYLVYTIEVSWTFGLALCRLVPFINMTTIIFTCLSFAAICIIRLLSHSVMKRSFREHPKYNSAIGLTIIAIISIVVCIPIAIFHNVENSGEHKLCILTSQTLHSHIMWNTLFILSFAVPFTILWSVNPLMYFYRRKFFSAMSTETFSSNGKSENQMTFLLFMFALSFTFLLGPLEILYTLHYFDVAQLTTKAIKVTYSLYSFFPASIPLIYFASFYSTSSGILFHSTSSGILFRRTSSGILYTSV
ncbi:apelin receptor-like [Anneissia japonica]|uniref:apelin receptor-like n=1 Tax=Anneissia japonica TaxID=1529436 RepID=UPI0014255499|nr:apelin receptor-like [Anneissia japonica]XP_033114700.1 apelin receptor-like [Anneissia japonica]